MDDASKETSDTSIFSSKRIRIFVHTIELCNFFFFFSSSSFYSFFFEVHRISLLYNSIFIDKNDTFAKLYSTTFFIQSVESKMLTQYKIIRLVNSLTSGKAFSSKLEVTYIKYIIVRNSCSDKSQTD